MALKKAYRLSGKTRLRSLRTYKTRAFLLKVAANNSSQRRFGFIVPKTVDKRAVVRNKVRRMFQACAENVVEKVVPGHDMLFIVHPQAKEISKEEICGQIRKLLGVV